MPDQISQLIEQLAQLKHELRDSEERFRSVITDDADGRLVVDLDGLIRLANPAAEQLLSRSAMDLIGSSFGFPIVAGDSTEIELLRVGDPPLVAEMRVMTTQWVGQPAYLVSLRDVTQQRRAAADLQLSERKYRSLAESLPQIIFEANATGRLTFSNHLGLAAFGYTRADLDRGLIVLDTIIPADRARAQATIERILRGEQSGVNEYTGLRRDGSTFPITVYSSLIVHDGQVIGLRGFIIDITEHKRVEAAEREQRTLAEALRDTSAALNSTLDFESVLDLILTNVDRIAPCDCASILLLSSDRQTAHSVRLSLRPGITVPEGGIHLSVAEARNLQVMLDTGQASIVANVRDYPDWVMLPRFEWVGSHAGAPIRARGQIVGFLNLYSQTVDFFTPLHAHNLLAFADQAGVALQNSQLYEQVQQYAAELEVRVARRTAELERERQRLQAILDTAGEGIVFSDANGTIEYMNPAMERLTGYTSAQALGQTPRLWSSGRTPVATYVQMWQTILHGEVWRGEVVNRHRAGGLYDTALIIAPLMAANRQIIGFVSLQRDITRQKELDRLKDQFVANVSHELRTPLANVKLYLNMLERGKPEKHAQYLQTLLRESSRLENLIENLLSISRLDMRQLPIGLTPTDVNQLITQLIFDRAALITERGLLLENRLAADLPPAMAEPALVSQIMSNLMTNATHYTPPGGVITLMTAHQPRSDCNWITLTVKDSGPGITAKDSPHLFERFYRGEAGRKSGAPGTGLGLAICREIAKQLGGEITVDSQPGQGAAFTVWLRPAQS